MKHALTAKNIRKTSGDTIVEVIIAISVIAAILTSSFILANNSTRGIRDSEEHAQALQFLQAQAELLRYAASQHGKLPAVLSTPFCLDSANYYQPAMSDPHCTFNSLYTVSIVIDPTAPPGGTTDTFAIIATWQNLNGKSDMEKLTYRDAFVP